MNGKELLIKRNWPVEIARKVAQKFHCCHDIISLDHAQVIQRQRKIGAGHFPFAGKSKDTPAFLVRVDDFPSPHANSGDYLKFHQVMKNFDLPYLLGVTPFWQGRPGFSTEEMNVLKQITREGCELALHGFTHEKKSPSCASELAGFSAEELEYKIKLALAYLDQYGFKPRVFIAPYNAYDAATISVFSRYFSILCGGPESVKSFGYRIPSFYQGSYYLPSYRYAYDLKADQQNQFEGMIEKAKGIVVPLSFHWANEVKDDFSNFRTILSQIHEHVISWSSFQESVEACKENHEGA